MKKRTYTGRGILSMLETCKKHNLTPANSTISIARDWDLGSPWRITTI